MNYSELIKTSEYWTAKIQIDLYNKVEEYMKTHNLNRSQLAEHLGVSKGYISQVLNGDFDHRISKLTQLALSIGLAPDLHFRPIENLGNIKGLTIAELRNEIFDLSKSVGLNVMIYKSPSETKPMIRPNQSSSPCLEVLTA